jgi:hypothetical protein
MRILPPLDRHIRDDWVGGLPAGASDLVAHSEHEGGVGGSSICLTAPKSITVAFPRTPHDRAHNLSWWARKDLNLGPMDYESTALTAELRAQLGY